MNLKWSVCSLCLLLVGCQANDDSIAQFINQTHQQAQATVEPLLEQPTFVAEAFVMTSPRSPFIRPRPEQSDMLAGDGACWQPDERTNRSALERYPIEQLSMRGVMGDTKQLWALIYTPEGKLVKVREGHFLGLNHGRVLSVSPKSIDVEEVLPDGEGCWLKRPIKLTLAQQAEKAV